MDYKYDAQARYRETDEWARVDEDGRVVIGISDYAQDHLSDIVYVELPEVGDQVTQGEECATVESVKAAAEIYAPASGEVVEINKALEEKPELLNEDPFGEAWLFKIEPDDVGQLDELMDADTYKAYNETREDH